MKHNFSALWKTIFYIKIIDFSLWWELFFLHGGKNFYTIKNISTSSKIDFLPGKKWFSTLREINFATWSKIILLHEKVKNTENFA